MRSDEQNREARAVNEQPWKPLPGMVKRRCSSCHYWFATPRRAQAEKCVDCLTTGIGKGHRLNDSN